VVNLALHAFLLANSKEALLAVINTVESSTSEDMEISLLLQLQTNSILSAPLEKADQAPQDITIPPTPPATTASQASAKRSKYSKGTKGNANTNKATTETSSGWGGITPLRKLHNIAVLLRTSDLLYQSWIRAIGIVLGIDNTTRWFSWLNVIDVAIQNRPAIVNWLMENTQDIDGNNLDKDDWDLLQKTYEFLIAFKQGILQAEQSLSSLSDAMMVLDILLIHCRRTRVS
jgi:hypothetical protein